MTVKGKAKQRKLAARLYRVHRENIYLVPAIANINAPTASELNAGRLLSSQRWHVATTGPRARRG